MGKLTRAEKEAVNAVLDEFLAGHDGEMVKAIGLAATEAKGNTLLKRVGSARMKLIPTDRAVTPGAPDRSQPNG